VGYRITNSRVLEAEDLRPEHVGKFVRFTLRENSGPFVWEMGTAGVLAYVYVDPDDFYIHVRLSYGGDMEDRSFWVARGEPVTVFDYEVI
jgi:hypothetical protein